MEFSLDALGPEPNGENRSAHHGRLRLSRTLPLLRSLRHISPPGKCSQAFDTSSSQIMRSQRLTQLVTVRKTLVRLRLRPRRPRRTIPQLHLQHDVPSPLARRNERRAKPSQRVSRQHKPLLDTHPRPLKLGAGILPSPFGLHISPRRGSTTG
jgi:hypothetical protein